MQWLQLLLDFDSTSFLALVTVIQWTVSSLSYVTPCVFVFNTV